MMKMVRLNQDPLENLFGAVRSSCGSNRHPTVSQFKGALKTCVITGHKKSNCELDNCTILNDLRSLFDVAGSSVNIPSETTGNINVQSSCNVSRIIKILTSRAVLKYYFNYCEILNKKKNLHSGNYQNAVPDNNNSEKTKISGPSRPVILV